MSILLFVSALALADVVELDDHPDTRPFHSAAELVTHKLERQGFRIKQIVSVDSRDGELPIQPCMDLSVDEERQARQAKITSVLLEARSGLDPTGWFGEWTCVADVVNDTSLKDEIRCEPKKDGGTTYVIPAASPYRYCR